MRKTFASLLGATVLVVVAAACANSTADIGDDTSETEGDSGVNTNPAASSTSNTFADAGNGNQGSKDSGSSSTDSGSHDSGTSTGTDSGSSSGTDSGSTSGGTGDVCDTSGFNGALYFFEYTQGDDGPCPCALGDCCYETLACIPE